MPACPSAPRQSTPVWSQLGNQTQTRPLSGLQEWACYVQHGKEVWSMAEGNKCLQDDRQRETNACRIQEEPLVKGDFSYLHSWTNNYWRRCWRVGEAGSYGGVEVNKLQENGNIAGMELSSSRAGTALGERTALVGKGRDHLLSPEGFTQQPKVTPSFAPALLQTYEEVRKLIAQLSSAGPWFCWALCNGDINVWLHCQLP